MAKVATSDKKDLKHCRLGRWMVGRCMDEIYHDSNLGQGTRKSNDYLGKYQTLGMYPVGSCTCLQ